MADWSSRGAGAVLTMRQSFVRPETHQDSSSHLFILGGGKIASYPCIWARTINQSQSSPLQDFDLQNGQNSLLELPALPWILTSHRCMVQGFCPKRAERRLELDLVDSSRLRSSEEVPADHRCMSTFFISISAFWGVCVRDTFERPSWALLCWWIELEII